MAETFSGTTWAHRREARDLLAGDRHPGTVVGGLVALISWLSVDAAAVGIDEHLHREELEHDLRTLLDERKHALAEDIKTGMKESRRERLSESPQIAPARLRSGI